MIVAVLIALAPLAVPAQTPPAAERAQLEAWAGDRAERMAWWREARFGMFIHWGLYAAAGGAWDGKIYPQHYAEWIQHWASVSSDEYARTLKPQFLPAADFAVAWAELAHAAGMRYAVLTSKHHDGFTLFNSQEEWSRSNALTGGTNLSPPGRDLAREFADAMRARGVRPGFYYSLLDWQHPHAHPMALPVPPGAGARDHARYVAYVHAHVRELLTGYGDLATLWFDYSDAERQGSAWGAADLLSEMRARQPAILVNNRLWFGLENRNGDYGTPEKYVPPTGIPGMDWEVNHTLNESYGYSSHDRAWKDPATAVRLLCDVVSKGGNLLLNVGPDATGAVPEEAQRTLRAVGAWLRSHGDSIYGTTASPFARLPWGRATQKPGQLYLMVFDWPADGVLRVPMAGGARTATLLAHGRAIPIAPRGADDAWLELRLPAAPVGDPCPVIRLELAGPVEPLPFAVRAGADGVLRLTPHDATLQGPELRVEQVGAVGDVRFNLGYWLDPSASAVWPIGVDASRAGAHRVEADVACADASAGARVELLGAAATISFTVPATGGWQSYRTLDLGVMDLAAGNGSCTLRALTKPGEAVLNLREIRLIPVAGR